MHRTSAWSLSHVQCPGGKATRLASFCAPQVMGQRVMGAEQSGGAPFALCRRLNSQGGGQGWLLCMQLWATVHACGCASGCGHGMQLCLQLRRCPRFCSPARLCGRLMPRRGGLVRVKRAACARALEAPTLARVRNPAGCCCVGVRAPRRCLLAVWITRRPSVICAQGAACRAQPPPPPLQGAACCRGQKESHASRGWHMRSRRAPPASVVCRWAS